MKKATLFALLAVAVGCGTAAPDSPEASSAPGVENTETTSSELRTPAVGLSLWFENGTVRKENGAAKTIDLYGDAARYVQELLLPGGCL